MKNTKDSIPVAYIEERIEDFSFKSYHATKRVADKYDNDIKALKSLLWSWEIEYKSWKEEQNATTD